MSCDPHFSALYAHQGDFLDTIILVLGNAVRDGEITKARSKEVLTWVERNAAAASKSSENASSGTSHTDENHE